MLKLTPSPLILPPLVLMVTPLLILMLKSMPSPLTLLSLVLMPVPEDCKATVELIPTVHPIILSNSALITGKRHGKLKQAKRILSLQSLTVAELSPLFSVPKLTSKF